MKYLTVIYFLVFFTAVSLCADSSLDLINSFSAQACALDQKINESSKIEADSTEFIISDFVSYMTYMESKFSNRLDPERKQLLNAHLCSIRDTLDNHSRSASPEKDQIAYQNACDIISQIYSDVLFVPFSEEDYSSSSENGRSAEMNKKIIDAAMGAVGQSETLYGIQVYNQTTEYGGLACAAVVSAILTKAGLFKYPADYKVSAAKLQEYLCSSKFGYRGIKNDKTDPKDIKPADIACWKHYSGERIRHIGIVTGRDAYGDSYMCVDNSGALKYIWLCPLVRNKSSLLPDSEGTVYEVVDPVIRK